MTEQTEVQLAEILSSSEPAKTVTIKVGEKSFDLTYRPLSWLDKSSCVAVATEYQQGEEEGEVRTIFHIDIYFEEALKRMITNSPWPMSRQVLRGLKPEIGEQLQAIIPSPLGGDVNLKKGSSEQSKTRRPKTRSSLAAPSN